MENQHRKIKGYKLGIVELTQDEIDMMNEVKECGVQLDVVVKKLKEMKHTDKRWVAIGATDLQTGLMALTRAVAKPDFF